LQDPLPQAATTLTAVSRDGFTPEHEPLQDPLPQAAMSLTASREGSTPEHEPLQDPLPHAATTLTAVSRDGFTPEHEPLQDPLPQAATTLTEGLTPEHEPLQDPLPHAATTAATEGLTPEHEPLQDPLPHALAALLCGQTAGSIFPKSASYFCCMSPNWSPSSFAPPLPYDGAWCRNAPNILSQSLAYSRVLRMWPCHRRSTHLDGTTEWEGKDLWRKRKRSYSDVTFDKKETDHFSSNA
jgi:hypothetical protein